MHDQCCYTFALKHRSGNSNKVVDVISRRQNLLIEMIIEVVGFEELKHLYEARPKYMEAWKEFNELVNIDRSDLIILFKIRCYFYG